MSLFELLTESAKQDTDLLRKNDKLGDVFTTPREVNFDFVTSERERADDFAAFVNGKSYGVATVSDHGQGEFLVVVLIKMPITQNVLCSVSGFMLCLSRLFGIDYSGWGSVIQSS